MVNTSNIPGFNDKTLGATCVSPCTGKTYTLTFIDDFNGDKLDETVWSYDKYNSSGGEVQAYVPENVTVENSNLVITARKERAVLALDGDGDTREAEYTSGKIVTKDKYSYQYGRCEMWAKLPHSRGMWPAFWSMGIKRGWPWGGEIDIMEMVGGDDQWGNKNRDAQHLASLHWCDPDVTPEDAWHTGKGVNHDSFGRYDLPGRAEGQKLGDEYHLYGCEWTKDKIISYIDDIKISEYDITIPSAREAFHQPHYLLLNLALGGSWAGDVIDEMLPQTFKVDWVKVWQEK